MIWMVVAVWLLSRWWGLAVYPHFFDGWEYLNLSDMGYGEALRASHAAIHPLSIALWQSGQALVPEVTVWEVAGVSMGLGLLGLLFLMWVIRREWGVTQAVIGGLAYTILPLAWLLQTNIASEPLTHLLLFVGYVGWWRGREGGRWRMVGVIALTLAIFNYPAVVWWTLPLMVFGRARGQLLLIVAVGMGAYLGLLQILGGGERMTELGGIARAVGELLTPIGLARAGYKSAMGFVSNYSAGAVLALGYWLWKGKARNCWKVTAVVAISYLVSMNYWHGGVFGRVGGILVYALPLVYAKVNWRVGVVSLLLTGLSLMGVMGAYKGQSSVPMVQAEMLRDSCVGRLVVISQSERPYLEREIDKYVVTGLGETEGAKGEVKQVLTKGEKVCVSRQAWNYPYRQYDGQRPHVLQGGEKDIGELALALEEFQVELIRQNEQFPLLGIYEVIDL